MISHLTRPEKNNATAPTPTEITAKMIDAGEDALLGSLGGAVECNWNPRELASQVYRAMFEVRNRV